MRTIVLILGVIAFVSISTSANAARQDQTISCNTNYAICIGAPENMTPGGTIRDAYLQRLNLYDCNDALVAC
jgi:hypothetical protein